MRALLVLVLATAALGPRAQTPAPLRGDRGDLDRLAGEWVGAYTGDATERHGTLVVRLDAGADSLVAVVYMVPRATDARPDPEPVALAVRHVAVEGRTFRGALAPYDDPEWRLPLDTEFGGTLTGDDRIEGFFRAAGTQVDTIPQEGRWWAVRVASLPAALTP